MNETTYVYIVHSDINENNIYAEFEKEEEAIAYARRNKAELTYVDKVEVALDEDGDIIEMFDSETIWVYDEEDDFELEEEVNEFDINFEDEHPLDESINFKNDAEREEFFRLCDEIGIYSDIDIDNFKKEVGCTDDNILQALRDYRAELGPDFEIKEEIDFDKLVEELEEHEDMVECKECYDLVSKESCHKNKDGKYVCEKCCKTLTEDIAGLNSEQLTEMEAYLKSGKALQLEEYEEEYDSAVDIVSGELTYNTKTNTFDLSLGIYHASEDNNANNPERYTDEEEYSFDSLDEIYDEFPQYLEDIYKWHADKFSKLEEAVKCTDCGGELKDNKCTSCNRDFNLAKCKYCGGEVKDGKCMYCATKVDMVKCQYCGGEVENGKCTCCNELVENAMANGGFRTDGYRTALASYDSDDFEINVEFGLVDGDDYEVVDEEYLLCPGQTVADLVVHLSHECGFTNIHVRGERSAFRDDIKTLKRFKTVPGNHDYNDYGSIEDRLVESTSEVLVEAAGSKDKIKSEFDEAGYVTEGTYTFDKIYDAYVKAKKSEPASLKDFIEYIRETVISVNELYSTLGLPAPETYKVKRKAVAKMRADGSTFTEAIPMTRDELMDKEGTDDVELINAGRPEEERVELVEVDRTPWKKGDPVDPSVLNNSRYEAIRYNVFYGDYYVARAVGSRIFEGTELQDTDIICVFKYGTVSPYKVLDLMTAKDFKDLLVTENIDHRLCNYEWLQNKIAPMTVKRHDN